MKKEKVYIYFRESAIQSIISDIFSFGMLIVFLILNRYLLGDHASIAILIFFIWLATLLGKSVGGSRKFNKLEDLKEYVKNL